MTSCSLFPMDICSKGKIRRIGGLWLLGATCRWACAGQKRRQEAKSLSSLEFLFTVAPTTRYHLLVQYILAIELLWNWTMEDGLFSLSDLRVQHSGMNSSKNQFTKLLGPSLGVNWMWTKRNDHAPKVNVLFFLIYAQKGKFKNKIK